jgi:hypothetical protein
MMNQQPEQGNKSASSKQLVTDLDLLAYDRDNSPILAKPQLLEQMTTETRTSRLISSWQLWGALLALIFGGIGFTATSILLRLPTNPNCHKIYLPFTSATNRIYCAQLQAEKETVEGLLAAIALLKNLPKDHPLREEINRHVTQWAQAILAIGEQEFQEGKLDKAIEIARKIPPQIENHQIVAEKIDSWRSIWQQGEAIEIDIEKQLRLSNWNQAFLGAIKFLNVPNDYWKTSKYQETIEKITLAREESKKLDGAYIALRRKGVENILEAIKIASEIDASSYAYEEATKIVEEAKNELLEYAQNLIDNQQWSKLSALADSIPEQIDLQKQAQDWELLASAGRSADLGTVSGLELALAEAERIESSSFIYQQSQQLIQTWQLQKEDLAYLAKARDIAQPGNVSDLSEAIAYAKLIESNHPLYTEAQGEIRNWQREIELIEDRPLLDRAREISKDNDIRSWQQAINQASLISSNRALYSEAQALIRQWKGNIQTEEDRPFLNQGSNLASNGNYSAAIDAASQIRAGRVLYGEAQRKIRGWRREIKAESDLNQAYQIAEANTPESLLKAINLARGIPSSTSIAGQSRLALNRWSEKLLAIARQTANYEVKYSLQEAINIAEMIPYGTSAYEAARTEISTWQNQLKPPLVIPPLAPLPIQETNFSPET